jgi:hypothetical protein
LALGDGRASCSGWEFVRRRPLLSFNRRREVSRSDAPRSPRRLVCGCEAVDAGRGSRRNVAYRGRVARVNRDVRGAGGCKAGEAVESRGARGDNVRWATERNHARVVKASPVSLGRTKLLSSAGCSLSGREFWGVERAPIFGQLPCYDPCSMPSPHRCALPSPSHSSL